VWTGVVQDTGEHGELGALICARERVSGYAQSKARLQGRIAARSCTPRRGAQLDDQGDDAPGFGKAHLRLVSPRALRMRVDALRGVIEEDLAAGNATLRDRRDVPAPRTPPRSIDRHRSRARRGARHVAPRRAAMAAPG